MQENTSTKTFTLIGDREAPVIAAGFNEPSEDRWSLLFRHFINNNDCRAVTDNVGVAKVELRVDGKLEATMTNAGSGLTGAGTASATWTKTLTISSLQNPNYADKTVEIIAYDLQENTSTKTFTLIGDTVKPTITIDNTNNSPLLSSFDLEGTCSDDIKVTRIVIAHEGGSTWDSSVSGSGISFSETAWSKSITVADLGGTYTNKNFTVTAYDAQGNNSSASVTFIGDKNPPTITINQTSGDSVNSVKGFVISGTTTDRRENGVDLGVVSSVKVKFENEVQTATLSGNNWSIDSSQFVTAMSNGTVTLM